MERQPWDGLPALMMADQKGRNMTTLEKRYHAAIIKIGYEKILSFPEQIKKLLVNTRDLKTKTELLEEIEKYI